METLDFPKANPADVNKINKSLNQKNVLHLGGISPKFVKIAASTIDAHITNILNNNISKTLKKAKIEYVRPIKERKWNIIDWFLF